MSVAKKRKRATDNQKKISEKKYETFILKTSQNIIINKKVKELAKKKAKKKKK